MGINEFMGTSTKPVKKVSGIDSFMGNDKPKSIDTFMKPEVPAISPTITKTIPAGQKGVPLETSIPSQIGITKIPKITPLDIATVMKPSDTTIPETLTKTGVDVLKHFSEGISILPRTLKSGLSAWAEGRPIGLSIENELQQLHTKKEDLGFDIWQKVKSKIMSPQDLAQENPYADALGGTAIDLISNIANMFAIDMGISALKATPEVAMAISKGVQATPETAGDIVRVASQVAKHPREAVKSFWWALQDMLEPSPFAKTGRWSDAMVVAFKQAGFVAGQPSEEVIAPFVQQIGQFLKTEGSNLSPQVLQAMEMIKSESNLTQLMNFAKTGESNILTDELIKILTKPEDVQSFAQNVISPLTKIANDILVKMYKPAISPKLQPLVEEARKYKSAGEAEVPTTKIEKVYGGIPIDFDNFVEQDLKPVGQGVVKSWDFIKKLLVPVSRGVEAQQTASIMREELGRKARATEQTFATLNKSRIVFDKFNKDQSIQFIDDLESGKTIKGSEKFISVMRQALDSRYKKIMEIKGTNAYIENYFPHIWKNPEQSKPILSQMYGKKPLEGTKSYLKQRIIPTIKEGIALGLEPVSYNPVDLVMARIDDMDKFLMANKVWEQFKEQGLRKFVRMGDKVPDGWITIDDKIANSFQFSPKEKGMILRGRWYMPENAATIVNNYLSPGLMHNPIYTGYRKIGNAMNMVQLGMSAYHALFTSIDAVNSYAALNIQKVFTPSFPVKERILAGIKAVISPYISPFIVWNNIGRGNKLLQDYYKENPEIPQIVDALERAGGRVSMGTFYYNNAIEGFMKAVRSGNQLGASLRLPGANIELISKPIMQMLVPRQKLGVFADGAKMVLEQAEREKWSEAKTTYRLQEVWDSVDNRLGQMVYDNLFWNKTLKDLSMGTMRSVGWNLGSVKEVIGGIGGYGKALVQVFTKEGRAEMRMTPRMAYLMALCYVVGTFGAIYHYLHTGKRPKTLIDYYYPKTGKIKNDGSEEKVALPTYTKDVFSYAIEPGAVAVHKLHPEISALADMLMNKDYYGTEIRNADDPIVKQMEQLAIFQAKQFVPFSITNMIKRSESGGSWNDYLESFMGITPAPAYITRTPLQRDIYKLYDRRFGGGVKTQEDRKSQQVKNQAKNLYLAGKDQEAKDTLKQALKSGILKESQIPSFVQSLDIPNDIRLFSQLPSPDQVGLLNRMNLVEINRYIYYAHKDILPNVANISTNTKIWLDMFKKKEITRPIFKKGIEQK